MQATFLTLCERLTDAARQADANAFNPLLDEFRQRRERAAPAELSEAARTIGRTLARTDLRLHYAGALAVTAGALVERGADPAPLVDPVPRRLRDACAGARRHAAGQGDPADREAHDGLENLALAACTLLQVSRDMRAGTPDREGLLRDVTAAIPLCAQLDYVRGLLRVLDGERLLVLHLRTRRGWSVLPHGVGDNAQLQVLLAAALTGGDGLLQGTPPAPWIVSCFSEGPVRPDQTVSLWWTLTDTYGGPIGDNDVPADVPSAQGVRVVILDEAGARPWPAFRRYPLMPGRIEVEREFGSEALVTTWQAVAHYHAATAPG